MNPSLIEQERVVNEVFNLVGKAEYDFEFEGSSPQEYSKKHHQFVRAPHQAFLGSREET